MRSIVTAAILASLALPVALPAEAQTRLPRKGPAERQVEELNRTMQQDQRQYRLEQRLQFENNQIRQNIDRQRMFSNPSSPARIGTCPAGSIGCN